MSDYLKMYIAVHADVEDFMVPTLVAHTIINAHKKFSGNSIYEEWLEKSYRKVVLRVGNREFEKIKTLEHFAGYENTQMNAQESCLVVLPVSSNAIPNVLKFAKPWAPVKGEKIE